MTTKITVTAWNNGQHYSSGAGYGLKLSIADRDRYFKRSWKTVKLHLAGRSRPVEVNIDKPSFWGLNCRELVKKEIGLWLIEEGLAPWTKWEPPKLTLESVGPAELLVWPLSLRSI
jgi:hypothetical protein